MPYTPIRRGVYTYTSLVDMLSDKLLSAPEKECFLPVFLNIVWLMCGFQLCFAFSVKTVKPHKLSVYKVFLLVAGAGFEPATFGL